MLNLLFFSTRRINLNEPKQQWKHTLLLTSIYGTGFLLLEPLNIKQFL